MAKTSPKTAFKKLEETLGKVYGLSKPWKKRPVIELLVQQVIGKTDPPAKTSKAAALLMSHFHDWNEVRVSNTYEIAGVLSKAGLEDCVPRARKLRTLLLHIFQYERKYTFEVLVDLPEDRVRRFFAKFRSLDQDHIAVVLSAGLDMHTTPVNAGVMRLMKRMGLLQMTDTLQRTQKFLDEHLIPEKMYPMYRILDAHATAVCTVDHYDCFSCVLKKDCELGSKARKPVAKKKKAARAPARKKK